MLYEGVTLKSCSTPGMSSKINADLIASGLVSRLIFVQFALLVFRTEKFNLISIHFSGDLPETQLYALIVLENAGVDLESFEFDKTTGWKQAWGAVMQVVKTLAEGEVKARFEVSWADHIR
jgi:hypothetical protein